MRFYKEGPLSFFIFSRRGGKAVRIFFKNKTSCPTSDGKGFFNQFILKKALLNK